jgi:hypothetical protein
LFSNLSKCETCSVTAKRGKWNGLESSRQFSWRWWYGADAGEDGASFAAHRQVEEPNGGGSVAPFGFPNGGGAKIGASHFFLFVFANGGEATNGAAHFAFGGTSWGGGRVQVWSSIEATKEEFE